MATLAFDVYGTLIDTQGVIDALRQRVGDQAQAFSDLWRSKQLEYSFRRGLMRRYQHFGVCTAQALDYCCAAFGLALSGSDRSALMACYARLPAFSDVQGGLERLNEAGMYMVAFSNGNSAAVEGLLDNAGIRHFFSDVISVDEIGTFKPNPDVYRHLLQRCGSQAADTWLISSNPFDVIGARAEALNAAWVQRSPRAVFDPWEYQPNLTVSDLVDLAQQLK